MENQLLPRASQGTKLQDRLKLEKSKLSYADLHSEVKENADSIRSTSGNHQKLRVERKATENEELVKYMSNLPSYLEREEKLWKKAFNVGVLDWRHLEKWQYNHKGFPYRSSRNSLSSSNASSFFSTEGSSAHSSRGPSCSPARQRIHRPTLQSLLIASPKEGYSQGVKSFGGNGGNSQDLKAASSEPLKKQQRMLRTHQSFEKEIKMKECKKKDSYPHIGPDIKVPLGFENYGMELHSKGKMKIQEGESRKGVEKMQEPYHNIVDHDLNYRSSSEANPKRFSEVLSSEEAYSAELYYDIPHSCPLPCEVDKIKCSHLNQSKSLDKKSIRFSSELSKSLSSAKISTSPSRGKKASKHLKPYEVSDLKMGTVATKVRNSSPIRRFSIDMGKARSASSKDGSVVLQLSSQHVTAKSDSDKYVTPDCLDSTSDKPNSTSRARSSPLRRLLEPLLKPKTANSLHFAESLRKDSSSTYGACKSSDGRVESSKIHPVKVKDFTSSRTSSANDSHHRERHGPSTVQAFLKIAIKNGLPVFTFAIGKNVDILVATMKKIQPSEKDDNSCIYTFFSICEAKSKNGRINQRSKGKGPGYVPNVVAQMKVSNSPFLKSIKHNPVDQISIREFVLFAVDLNHVNRRASGLQPNDELAAIVVKFSKEPPSCSIQDGHQSDNFNQSDTFNHISVTGLKDPLPEVTGYSNFKDNKENGSSVGGQDPFNMTVILPGGVHGLPIKGEPSPLIERWISGGLCDCGGWDLGCRMRVFANQTQLKRSSSSKAHPTAGRFELFTQGEVLDDRPLFSLSRFGDGIFSAEFNSSLSLLQAFSICIAVLNNKKPYELSESSHLFEEKSSKETTLAEHEGIKVPVRYASFPPFSPVGRV